MAESSKAWQLWIDTGGTFTDCIGVDPDGTVHRAKVLSSAALRGRVVRNSGDSAEIEFAGLTSDLPDGFFVGARLRPVEGSGDGVEVTRSQGLALHLEAPWTRGISEVDVVFDCKAPVLAARIVTRTAAAGGLPPAEVRFATTRGTNALLERRGSPPVLFVTRGFADLLEIGNQQRSDLFALRVRKSRPLHGAVVEVDERLRPDGSVERALDVSALEGKTRSMRRKGCCSAAVALMHGYRNPSHEQTLAAHLRRIGFEHVSTSSDLSTRIKLVQRARTAVVDAYLASVVGDYLQALERELGARSLYVMNSSGGLARASEYRPKDSLLSGPAGGVVGAVAAAARSGADKILSFDMGGTSTDVARHDGRLEYDRETIVGDARLASPCVAVHTVAAGGGSICRFDGRQLKVGPESAGADPGPACYGRGGPLTLTDVNLLLGRLSEADFPFTVDRRAAADRAVRVRDQYGLESGEVIPAEELLLGFLRIANESMAGAVRAISLAAGYRPSDYVLVTFGGAGPQHACGLAQLLGMSKVLVPAEASLLSAVGLGNARLERFAEFQVLKPLSEVADSLAERFASLRSTASADLARSGVDQAEVDVDLREVFLRYAGQEATLSLDWHPDADLAAGFEAAYRRHFGYVPRHREIEVESLRLIAVGPRAASTEEQPGRGPGRRPRTEESFSFYGAEGWLDGRVVERRTLIEGDRVVGPAQIVEANTLTLVEPGWMASADSTGCLVVEKR